MNRKELILRMISKLEDDVSYDRVMYHLAVMRSVEIGMKQTERGEVIPHEQVFAELLDTDEETTPRLDAKSKRRTSADKEDHSKSQSAGGKRVRTSTQKVR